MDETICPKCQGKDTYVDYEDVYKRNYAVRGCENCGCSYKIQYQKTIQSIEVIRTPKNLFY